MCPATASCVALPAEAQLWTRGDLGTCAALVHFFGFHLMRVAVLTRRGRSQDGSGKPGSDRLSDEILPLHGLHPSAHHSHRNPINLQGLRGVARSGTRRNLAHIWTECKSAWTFDPPNSCATFRCRACRAPR